MTDVFKRVTHLRKWIADRYNNNTAAYARHIGVTPQAVGAYADKAVVICGEVYVPVGRSGRAGCAHGEETAGIPLVIYINDHFSGNVSAFSRAAGIPHQRAYTLVARGDVWVVGDNRVLYRKQGRQDA